MNGYKTIIGAAIAMLAAILSAAGVDIGTIDMPALGNQLAGVIGGVIAIYGRIVATKNLKSGEALK